MNTKEKHQAISHLKNKNRSISMLCHLFKVSQSGYFSSLKNPISPRKIRREKLTEKVTNLFTQHKSRYGRPRIYRQLRIEGESISEKMVGRLMRSESLQARKKHSFRPRTTQDITRPKYAPNLLKNRATPNTPNEVVVTDITYVATKENWLYLAAVMDLHSRKIKGYEIQETMHTNLIGKALEKAMKQHPDLTGCIHHSDRGSQYTSHQYLEPVPESTTQCSI